MDAAQLMPSSRTLALVDAVLGLWVAAWIALGVAIGVEVAGVRAARPIAVAGLVLSAAFALLALVPLRSFREIAFAMAAGLLIDAFIVRAILVPGLVVLVGQRSAWPRTLPGDGIEPGADRGEAAGARAPRAGREDTGRAWRRSPPEGPEEA